METRTRTKHIICGACRITWLKKDVTTHKGDREPKIERCCRCGYKTLYGVLVTKSHDEFYCQKERVHDLK